MDYRKASADLVYDLINESNPNLPIKVSKDNCTLGVPTIITPGAGDFRNTRISINALSGKDYRGAASLTYRRINPALLFPGGKMLIDNYSANTTWTAQEFCDVVNAKYGLGWVGSELVQTSFSTAVGTGKTGSFIAGDLAYVGAFTYDRLASKKPVSAQVPENTAGLVVISSGLPAGVLAVDLADFLTFSGDFSRLSTKLASLSAALTVLPQDTDMAEVVKYMSSVTGLRLALDVAPTTRLGLLGCRSIRYALPNANVPEANAADYNNVIVISPPAAGACWFKGRFLLHYKV